MRPIIRFSEDDWQKIRKLAHDRYYLKRKAGVPDTEATGCFAWDVLGVMGEAAFSRYYGTPMRQMATLGGDDGYDAVLSGYRIGVKATRARNRYLAPAKRDYPLQVHALALFRCLSKYAAEFTGWVTVERFMAEHEVRTLRQDRGPMRVMEIERLAHAGTLKSELLLIRNALV